MDETSSTPDHPLAGVTVHARTIHRLPAMDRFLLAGTALAAFVITGMLIASSTDAPPRLGFVAGGIAFLLSIAAVRLAATKAAPPHRRIWDQASR